MNMALFTEAGRGRKKCPNCGIFTGVLSASCEKCSHKFEKKDATPAKSAPVVATVAPMKVQATVAAAPAPKPVLAAPAPVTKLKVRSPTSHVNLLSNLPVINVFTPAGECPVKLKGTDIEQVAAWADAVRDDFGERRMVLAIEALLYFAQTIYDFKSDECKLVKGHLVELFVN
jgi:hypothetical protein